MSYWRFLTPLSTQFIESIPQNSNKLLVYVIP